MGIAYGLLSAVVWGAADFLARSATQRIGTYRTLLFMEFIGTIALTAYVLASGDLRHTDAALAPWLWALTATVLGTAGGLAIYRSYEIGVLSIVSPVASSYAAITVVAAVLSGETLTALRWAGIAVTLLGVAFASYHRDRQPDDRNLDVAAGDNPRRAGRQAVLAPGVLWAFAAAVAFGVSFWLLGFRVTPELGNIIPVWIQRLVSPLILILAARPLRQSIRIPQGSIWWLIAIVGLLDVTGFLAATTGLQSRQVAIVSVMISLYSAVTVLLAWIFLRERVWKSQWLGIALIFVGVGVLAA